MHTPTPFKVSHEQTLDFLIQQGFGLLCSIHEGSILSTPVPYLFNPSRTSVYFHLAHANPHWHNLAGAMIQVMGPHAYVSPTLYEEPGVPTWNYQTAKVSGQCSIIKDPAHKRQQLIAMAEHFEQTQPTPWVAEFDESLVKAIVMVEMSISTIEGKFKLGQNRSEKDQANLKKALLAKGNPLAKAM